VQPPFGDGEMAHDPHRVVAAERAWLNERRFGHLLQRADTTISKVQRHANGFGCFHEVTS
jgi:hypothetical protein